MAVKTTTLQRLGFGLTTTRILLTTTFILVLSTMTIEGVHGQTCETYKNGTGFGFCDKWVDYQFYLPAAPTKWIG